MFILIGLVIGLVIAETVLLAGVVVSARHRPKRLRRFDGMPHAL